MYKNKIINDPLYGFISLSDSRILDIIEHPYVQRLRRIRQLGVAEYVYPGAIHTRFHHALGAMHLMGLTLEHLREKNHNISDDEFFAAQVAILLHDIGHGPFSHSLENMLYPYHHEAITTQFLEMLNMEKSHELDDALLMFNNHYPRPFFHQLISGQLDMDRLDYLQRDSFYTGVHEGTIGAERIIKMTNLVNDKLVVEEKGIYSIENFLSSRRYMYWQVYLHKTVIGVEKLLQQIILRAKEVIKNEPDGLAQEALLIMLKTQPDTWTKDHLSIFSQLDDYDVWQAIKNWQKHPDAILSTLSSMFINRKLPAVTLENTPFDDIQIYEEINKLKKFTGYSENEISYFINTGEVSNAAYLPIEKNIDILMKTGEILDVSEAVELPNIKAMSKIVKKYYLCRPKTLSL